MNKVSEKALRWKPGRNEAAKLARHGFDGLYFPGECACLIDDLYPCGQRMDGCLPGYKGNCTDDCTHEGAGEGNWHVSATKPAALRGDREAEAVNEELCGKRVGKHQ